MTRRRIWKNLFLKTLVVVCGGAVLVGAITLVVYVLARGFSYLNYTALTSEPSLLFNAPGLMPAIANTLLMMFAVTLVGMPFGWMASWMLGYIKPGKLKTLLLYITEVVAELPPVVYGLLGMLVFCQWFGMGVSVLAGSFTMGAMLATDVMAHSENYQHMVDWRKNKQAVSLGATPGQLMYTILIPEAFPWTAAGFLRAMARVAAETITLLLTLGAGTQLAENLVSAFHQSGGTLSVMMYIYVQQRGDYDTGFAIAALLLLLIGGLIVASNLCIERLGKSWKR